MTNAPRRRRRITHFPVRRSVTLSAETAASLDRAAERYGVAAATIMRDAVERGLKLSLEVLRKQGGRNGGMESAK